MEDESIALKITVSKKDEEPVEVDIPDPNTTFEDMIEQLADLWDVKPDEHILLHGDDVYKGKTKISDASLKNEDVLVMVHKNNVTWPESTLPVSEPISFAFEWLDNNIGLDPNNLKIISDDKKMPRKIVFEDKSDGRKYQIELDLTGKVKEYKPISN